VKYHSKGRNLNKKGEVEGRVPESDERSRCEDRGLSELSMLSK
jgi:hypothetical protein